ncbi:RNA polymerase II transcriptional coactivator KELP [Mercurialis annua]|uniref:RNA polymerase II transcriptional coactivator KELP n=1 Tax=Mercurialis annua TaxID=3986 RepID=UPI0021605CA6|nr:RNA polymerase II transcriptional coactivator KELP [Mercurialis annua]
MEPKLKIEIEQTVREIIEQSDMETTTEGQIRKIASRKLDLDLNQSEYKAFVRHVVNNFLEEQQSKEEARNKEPEYDDDGDLIICKLSDKRKVTIQNFKGTTLVSIREFYNKDGRDLPTSKGISLKEEQWAVLKKNMSAIQEAIREMKERL